MRNEEVVRRVTKERNILHTVTGREGSFIGHMSQEYKRLIQKVSTDSL